jgi:hypothetical protein
LFAICLHECDKATKLISYGSADARPSLFYDKYDTTNQEAV